MVNLVKLYGNKVELPYHRLAYPITPPPAKLQAGLESYDALRLDLALQSLPSSQRKQVVQSLRRFGRVLHDLLFPPGQNVPVDARLPLLLELGPEWAPYPWELLNDGDEWWALRQGVARYLFAPDHRSSPPVARGEPLRVAAVTARPLPEGGEPLLARHEAELGSRFVTVAAGLVDAAAAGAAPYVYAPFDHAGREGLEAALRRSPHVLLFSGFASPEGWYLESSRLSAQKVGHEWLAAQFKQAAREPLLLLLVNDSLGLLDSRQATGLTRAALDAGVPAVVRIEGFWARLREQDYARSLFRLMGEGAPVFAAHLASARRLERRLEDGWDWSFVRLHLRSHPPSGDFTPAATEQRAGLAPRREESPAARPAAPFAPAPAPPVFSGRRRTFNRHADLARLAGALLDDARPRPPLLFLSGPAGSGKTMLALDLARRLHARFEQTAYVHARELLPDPFDLAPAPALTRPAGGSLEQLFGALARHLRAKGTSRAGGESWQAAVAAHLGDGARRLIILDRLETVPGYEGFCAALQDLPGGARFLLLGRRKPPRVPGKGIELAPLDRPGLRRTFGEDLLERLAESPLAAELEAACAQDLLAARILRRLPEPPAAPALREALGPSAAAGAGGGRATAALLDLLAGQALKFVSADGRDVLGSACLFTHLAHRDALAVMTALEGRRLQNAFTELQWLGLLDAWDGDRYVGIPPRLQQTLGERLLTGPVYRQRRERMVQAYQSYLGQAAPAVALAREGAPMLGWWRDSRVTAPPGALAEVHRLGIERANVAELAALLAEERDWAALRLISDAAQALQGVPEWADCLYLVNHCLLSAGDSLADPVLQAKSLCRIGAGLVASGRLAAAEPPLVRALELIGPTSAWEAMAEIYHWMSRCHLSTGRCEAAANLLLAAAELAQQTGNAEHLAQALEGLAEAWRGLPDGIAEAERYLPARIEYLEQRGHGAAAARCRRLLGDLYQQAGRGREARAVFQDAEARFRHEQVAPEAYATALRVAEGYAQEGSPQAALDALREARGQWPGQANPAAEGRLLTRVAQGLHDAGDSAASLEAYLEARRMLETCGDREGVIRLLDVIGGLYYRLGDHARSTRCYEERLQLQAPAPARP